MSVRNLTQQQTSKTLRQRAIEAHRAKDFPSALAGYSQHLARRPEDAGIWSNLGVLFRTVGQHRKSLVAQTKASQLAPDDKSIQTNLANILSDLGEYDMSIMIRKRLLEGDPHHLEQLAMIGRCLRGKGDYTAALDHLEAAIAHHSEDPELRMQHAFALLCDGQFSKGFAAYTARWEAGEIKPRKMTYPQWSGQSLKDKTITVLPEQGFGDAVLFMRFLPHLESLGATVRVCAEEPILPLFKDLIGAGAVGLVTDDAMRGDYWVNMIDVAQHYFARHDEVPQPANLSLDESSVSRARDRAAPFQKDFKIGVVWTGSETYKGNAFRSSNHSLFDPLVALNGVQLFSLYKGPALKAFQVDGTSAFIVDAAHDDHHFGDCAAMMKEMDLIITTDTATAHIAGSFGLPTWVLLHWDPFWLWGHNGETTQWYPSVKLFRQKIPLDWAPVMATIKQALEMKLVGLDE